MLLPDSPSVASTSQLPPSRISTPDHRAPNLKDARPYLRHGVSRLRAHTPSSSPPSNDGSGISHSQLFDGSPAHFGFSSMSRVSSTSDFLGSSDNSATKGEAETSSTAIPEQEAFKWTDLQSITQTIFSKASQKASSLLGTPTLGFPTTLAANGLLCIGTTEGKVVVHDFKQVLLCVCESNVPRKR